MLKLARQTYTARRIMFAREGQTKLKAGDKVEKIQYSQWLQNSFVFPYTKNEQNSNFSLT